MYISLQFFAKAHVQYFLGQGYLWLHPYRLREIARVMPSTEVGRATGGVSAFTFLGVVIGPAVFTAIIGLSGSYSAAFLVVGTIAIGPAVILFLQYHNQK